MKLKLIENHQLPKDKSYLLENLEIKSFFEDLETLRVFKSHHAFNFDSTFNSKKTKIEGEVILTLSLSKVKDNTYLHQYGCKKTNLENIDPTIKQNELSNKLNNWLSKNNKNSNQLVKHRQLLISINTKGKLFYYSLEWV